MRKVSFGFTLVELMVVVAVIAILALMAMPNMSQRIVRDQIVEAMKIADVAKGPVAAAWVLGHTLPADNATAGLPPAALIVGTYVSSVSVEDGAIHVVFGNKANPVIAGKCLTLRPAVVEAAPVVPIAWVCGHANAVDKMVAKGVDRTSVDAAVLPLNCRAGS